MDAKSAIIGGVIGLISGSAAGFFGARWYFAKKADKEQQEFVEAFSKHYKPSKNKYEDVEKMDEPTETKTEEKPLNNNKFKTKDSIDYDQLKATEESYFDYNNRSNKKSSVPKNNKPIIISPDEFNDSSRPAFTLMYWADGVLSDDDFNVIKDVRGLIGDDALNSFGTYDGDDSTVYVYNPDNDCDYEIIMDTREYTEAAKRYGPFVNSTYGDDDDD